jgi:hypothetical protein
MRNRLGLAGALFGFLLSAPVFTLGQADVDAKAAQLSQSLLKMHIA